jgi:hypothetical protein
MDPDAEWHADVWKRLADVAERLRSPSPTCSNKDGSLIVAIFETLQLLRNEQHLKKCQEQIPFVVR